jgi:hypothetical protein
MRLRALLPFRARPPKRQARPVRLNCESLEGRELPAANLLGVNLSGVEDWSYDRLFADAINDARRPSNLFDYQGAPPIDANGWPATDASIVVWQGISNMNGTYQLSFTGQATVSTSWGATSITNLNYNASTNTTTAAVAYYPTDGSGLLLNFANTRRTPTSATNTGVTNIKLMRPVAPGSATSFDPSVTFTQPIKDLVSKFSVVRMMDDTGSNGTDVNGNWNLRRPAGYASQAAIGVAHGMAWEYAIQFWNETNTDAWVNIPYTADASFVTQLATLLKNNLGSTHKIYVEWSNEVWNSAYPYPAGANHNDAVAEVQANPNSPLNFDHVYPNQDPNGWSLSPRRIAEKTVEVSNIFRQVFGDDQMMTRIRPVLMSQLGWTGGWLAPELDYIEDYFDNAAYQSAPHPASYYIYGAGGSGYENFDPSNGPNTTVDQVFNTMPVGFNQDLQNDTAWTAAFGLKRIAYEGGPSLDNLTGNTNVPASVLQAAWGDPRMRTELVANQNTWSADGGDLFMYFASTGDYHWGLTNDPFNLNTQKLNAINDLNSQPAAAVTYGKAAPVDLTATDFNVPNQGTLGNMVTNSLTQEWIGSHFRVDASGQFDIRLTGIASNGGQVEFLVDGKSYGIVNVPANGNTTPIALGTLSPGEHGLVLRARAGTFGIGTVSVLADNTPATPPAPTNLAAAALSPASVQVSWNAGGTGQTGFLLERANDAGFGTGRVAFGTGPTTTTYLDSTAAAGTTYYYRVCAMNGTTESASDGPATATTPSATGLAATFFNNTDLTGSTATRTDAAINLYWPDLTSPAPGIDARTYSARWLGQVQTVESGYYKFQTFSDDGVRLWVNGKLVINNWTDHAGTYNQSAAVSLAAGKKYDIRLEYYNGLGGGVLELDWKRPTATGYVPIPTGQLTPATGGAALFADGFDTGLGQWSPASGIWKASSSLAGRGSGYVSSGTAPERLSLAGNAAWADYSVAAWVDLANLGGGVAILGRVVDATHYYQLSIQRGDNGQPAWVLMKRDGNTWTALASGSLTYNGGTWVRLRLTMSGSSLKAELSRDGTTFSLLGSANDTRYTAGRIGLRSWGVTASFDEVLVQVV